MTPYRAPRWLPGPHLQTIWPLLRKPPMPPFRRQRWDTPDGDFIDLDWLPFRPGRPLVVLFHGLEGSSRSHYARSLMQALAARGWNGVVPHFRGCSGAETFKPNPSPDQAIRSQQSNESLSGDLGAQGVPGALTNQPPVPATAPITAPPTGATGGTDQKLGTSARNSVINYELDKTVQHVRHAVGQVRRLSVAVVLNHRTTTANNGRTETAALSDEEVRKITDLIREAVGYSEQRGDTLNVANSIFTAEPVEELPEVPLWKDPEVLSLIGSLASRYLIPLAVLAFVAFGVIKPLMKQILPPPAAEDEASEAEGEEGEGEEGEEDASVTLSPEAAAAQSYEEKLARARQLAKDNPKMVANLVKEWMGAGSHEQR